MAKTYRERIDGIAECAKEASEITTQLIKKDIGEATYEKTMQVSILAAMTVGNSFLSVIADMLEEGLSFEKEGFLSKNIAVTPFEEES